MTVERQVLGRGLDQLLGRTEQKIEQKGASFNTGGSLENKILQIDIERIQPDPAQPRKYFDNKALEELAQSIKEQGLIQPIVVTKKGEHQYLLIAGERRWRAVQKLGWTRIPTIVRGKEEQQEKRLTLALVENIQRQDLNPMEEAKAFDWLLTEKKWTQQKLAEQIGRERSSIANTLRLLNLHPEVQILLQKNKISISIAKLLLQEKSKEKQKVLARLASQTNMTVQNMEKHLKAANRSLAKQTAPMVASWLEASIERLSKKWKAPLSIKVGNKKTTLTITFTNPEEMKEFFNNV